MTEKRYYKFYPQGLVNYAGYMTEEKALTWLKENMNDHREILGIEIIENMTKEQAYKYLESLKIQ